MIISKIDSNGYLVCNYTTEWLDNNGIDYTDHVAAYDVSLGFTKPRFIDNVWVESVTQEETDSELEIKVSQYKERINNYFSHMYIRALSSSMNKRSSDLNYLLGLREEYVDKYNVSKGTVVSGSNYDATQEAILGEMEDEFTEAFLDAVLPRYGLSASGTHLDKMYAIIVFKYEYGLNAFNSFNKVIRRFRTKCNSWVDSSDFIKLDEAFDIVDSLPSSLTVQDADILYNEFNAI